MTETRSFFERLTSVFRGGRDRTDASNSTRCDPSPAEGPLSLEWATYQAHKRELLACEGQWVVIHGDQILGIRPTYQEALQLGYEQVGFVAFLAQQILATYPVHTLPPQPI